MPSSRVPRGNGDATFIFDRGITLCPAPAYRGGSFDATFIFDRGITLCPAPFPRSKLGLEAKLRLGTGLGLGSEAKLGLAEAGCSLFYVFICVSSVSYVF